MRERKEHVISKEREKEHMIRNEKGRKQGERWLSAAILYHFGVHSQR